MFTPAPIKNAIAGSIIGSVAWICIEGDFIASRNPINALKFIRRLILRDLPERGHQEVIQHSKS